MPPDDKDLTAYVTWKDLNKFCRELESLKTWNKIILFLLSSNLVLNFFQLMQGK